MINFRNVKNLFIDFDGVIVDSNKFKEIAIEKLILKLLGANEKNTKAINFFNINAGISREKKLSKFFKDEDVSKILKLYAEECNYFFSKAHSTDGLNEFLGIIKNKNKNLKIFVLSGGEKKEIIFFLKKNLLLKFFDEILASEKNKLDHLIEKQVSDNDIFIGDSSNDLKAALKIGLKFILFGKYKSLKSFPSKYLIRDHVLFETSNFRSLINEIKL